MPKHSSLQRFVHLLFSILGKRFILLKLQPNKSNTFPALSISVTGKQLLVVNSANIQWLKNSLFANKFQQWALNSKFEPCLHSLVLFSYESVMPARLSSSQGSESACRRSITTLRSKKRLNYAYITPNNKSEFISLHSVFCGEWMSVWGHTSSWHKHASDQCWRPIILAVLPPL